MKKFNLFAVACMVAAFSFAQNAGQWSFGAGGNFVAPGSGDKDFKANIGYFGIDGLMISFDFGMGFDYETKEVVSVPLYDVNGVAVDVDGVPGQDMKDEEIINEIEGDFDWGIGLRYYLKDNLFFEGKMDTGEGEDPDVSMGAGVSLELAFDGRLWFEPMVRLTMPGEEYGVPNTFGLAWAFRYTF